MAGDYSNSNHIITWKGDVQTQDGEIILNGTNAYGEMADSADWLFPGAFTIELFGVKFASTTARQTMIGQYNVTGNQRGLLFRWKGDVSPKVLSWFISPDGSATQEAESNEFAPNINEAHDICVERDGDDNLRFYIDGTMNRKLTFSHNNFDSSDPLAIGVQSPNNSPTNRWGGRVKAIRLTKGSARYADDGGYTVPTLPLPTA